LLLEKNSKKAKSSHPNWYQERMQVLSAYKERETLENKIKSKVLKNTTLKKF